MKGTSWIGWVAAVLVAAAAAYLNRFERVTLDFGLFSIYAVPVVVVVFVAFLLGMVTMLLLSLPEDRRTRDLLRARGLSADPPRVTAGGIVAPPVPPTPSLSDPRDPVDA